MPIYEYSCLSCNKRFEFMQKITDEPILQCPHCKGELKKLVSNTSFVLKGTGWYVTDYAGKDAKSKDTDKDGETKPSETKSDSKKSDGVSGKAKSETTQDTTQTSKQDSTTKTEKSDA